jgi:methylenetetrahydrofolate--tRNA-(uracil-5-)-methyltransferase
MSAPIHIVGAGLAGCEAAWQLAKRGHKVVLREMRPGRMTPAHAGAGLAELVCSNSLRADDLASAVGLLHAEMRQADSLVLAAADATRVPAGGALAVDRLGFSQAIEARLLARPEIQLVRGEVDGWPPGEWGDCIIASGPLTSDSLAQAIAGRTGQAHLHFFDAIAPIVTRDSVDFSKAWFQSRYDKGGGRDYINCPLDRDQYEAFVAGLIAADTAPFHDWEKDTPYFEGCLPIEVMAARGPRTLAFGPMKPVGLDNPHGPRPYAVVQLRQDNAQATLYNLVGFQTKLRHGEQRRLFRTIPGLEGAEFVRLGGLHRNTFLNSPLLLDPVLRLKAEPRLRFAGQITGCEGYVESAAIGLLAGRFLAAERAGIAPMAPPRTTAMGSLLAHITGEAVAETFQPMNVNFGLFPPLPTPPGKRKPPGGKARKEAYAARAQADLGPWLTSFP